AESYGCPWASRLKSGRELPPQSKRITGSISYRTSLRHVLCLMKRRTQRLIHLIEFERPVKASRGESFAVGCELKRQDPIGLVGVGLDFRQVVGFENLNPFVGGARNQQLPVRRIRELQDGVFVRD